jgi:hypothetical protein
MATEAQRQKALDTIRENIARTGKHIYCVLGGPDPRFVYTIGVSEWLNFELVFAGGCFYSRNDAQEIINDIVEALKHNPAWEAREFKTDSCCSFTLRPVDSTWSCKLLLGALDYYGVKEIPALQVVPDKNHWTIDVPDMTRPWNAESAPIWRWLSQPWTYPVPKDSFAVTDLAALRGERVTEAARWGEDEWEIFVGDGPDIPKDEVRPVPLGVLVESDPSLRVVFDLKIEEGICRGDDGEWSPLFKPAQDGSEAHEDG